MSNYSLELDFLDDPKGEAPYPIAQIYVQRSGGYRGNPLRYITPDYATKSDFNHHIDRLEKELENIRTRGNAKFDAIQAR